MNIKYTLFVIWALLACCSVTAVTAQTNVSQNSAAAAVAGAPDDYLSWTAGQAERIGQAMRVNGRAGGVFDFRVINTDHAINYKLRATLLTPEVIRATARLEQIRGRLSDEATRKLVAEAEAAGHIVVLVEIDPREGSGVIPLDWRVFLQPKNFKPGSSGAVAGIKSPRFRQIKALTGVARRDYDYDVFWVAFPLVDENKKTLFDENISELDLSVGIYNKEGRVSWRITDSVRQRIKELSK